MVGPRPGQLGRIRARIPGAYGPAGAVGGPRRPSPAPHYRRAVSLRRTGAAGPRRVLIPSSIRTGTTTATRTGRTARSARSVNASAQAVRPAARFVRPPGRAGPTIRSRDDLHDGRRRIDHADAAELHRRLRRRRAAPPPSACSAISSAADAPLSASSRPPRTASGRHQRGQPVQRRDRAGGDHVAAERVRGRSIRWPPPRPGRGPPVPILARPSRSTDLDQERGPSGQRLDQGDREVGPRHRQHDAGQTGAGADVDHRRAGRDQLGDRRAVEQVPVPDPGCLPRADQAADHPVGGQQFGVRGGQRRDGRRRASARPGPVPAAAPRRPATASRARPDRRRRRRCRAGQRTARAACRPGRTRHRP